jgi:hypothetical protein
MDKHALNIYLPINGKKNDSEVLVFKEIEESSEYYSIDLKNSSIKRIDDIILYMAEKNYHSTESISYSKMLKLLSEIFDTFLKNADPESKKIMLDLFKNKNIELKRQ